MFFFFCFYELVWSFGFFPLTAGRFGSRPWKRRQLDQLLRTLFYNYTYVFYFCAVRVTKGIYGTDIELLMLISTRSWAHWGQHKRIQSPPKKYTIWNPLYFIQFSPLATFFYNRVLSFTLHAPNPSFGFSRWPQLQERHYLPENEQLLFLLGQVWLN